jgi:hypothetical protein
MQIIATVIEPLAKAFIVHAPILSQQGRAGLYHIHTTDGIFVSQPLA